MADPPLTVAVAVLRDCGDVSEHLHDGDGLAWHFVLHVCELEPASRAVSGSEGAVAWFDEERVLGADTEPGGADLEVVLSDRRILDTVVGGDGRYYEGVMDGASEEPRLERFERR